MKQKKILKKIDRAIQDKMCLEVYFYFAVTWFDFTPLYRSIDFVAASLDVDCWQNGYLIIPVKEIKSFVKTGNIMKKIMQGEHIVDNIAVPEIPLSSWYSIFRYFLQNREMIGIETASRFYIGYVDKIKKHSIRLFHVDANGEWCPPIKIKFEDIGVIYYQNRYVELCKKYAEKLEM